METPEGPEASGPPGPPDGPGGDGEQPPGPPDAGPKEEPKEDPSAGGGDGTGNSGWQSQWGDWSSSGTGWGSGGTSWNEKWSGGNWGHQSWEPQSPPSAKLVPNQSWIDGMPKSQPGPVPNFKTFSPIFNRANHDDEIGSEDVDPLNNEMTPFGTSVPWHELNSDCKAGLRESTMLGCCVALCGRSRQSSRFQHCCDQCHESHLANHLKDPNTLAKSPADSRPGRGSSTVRGVTGDGRLLWLAGTEIPQCWQNILGH